jgi:hypothetical protein
MTNRITDKDLQAACDRLNRITGNPLTSYAKLDTPIDGRTHAACIGSFHISHAYGGVCLHQMVNDGGGVRTVVTGGHIQKRELFHLIHAYIGGIEDQKHGAAS